MNKTLGNKNLFVDGDYYEKAITPAIGMECGTLLYEHSHIKKWIELYCQQSHKSCRLSRSSKGTRKVFVCTSNKPKEADVCPWQIVVCRGKSVQNNMW